jgi:hypothetical protein
MVQKAEMMEELLAGEDDDAHNKEHDADKLLDMYLSELNVRLETTSPPGGPPGSGKTAAAAPGPADAEDALLIERVRDL